MQVPPSTGTTIYHIRPSIRHLRIQGNPTLPTGVFRGKNSENSENPEEQNHTLYLAKMCATLKLTLKPALEYCVKMNSVTACLIAVFTPMQDEVFASNLVLKYARTSP